MFRPDLEMRLCINRNNKGFQSVLYFPFEDKTGRIKWRTGDRKAKLSSHYPNEENETYIETGYPLWKSGYAALDATDLRTWTDGIYLVGINMSRFFVIRRVM